ncbi:helix-turn-helix domain-containing protein [Desulforhopalus singaporensis]|uniref:Helix-turn-helix domain-containing protein n=1 Tax=Desulforhopalus singaporensis TaxID=91360 RepID=A0A1H0PR72_9BACT|nr:helix-turn-helix domain-containing protein [Desulforhopalus singaporensis]SDP07059.1 Helix-turn-helix domain-containing protein [Desulforhopalus singaporensis]
MTKKKRKTGRGKNQSGPYPFEFRLRVVRMYLEEEYPVPLIIKETGVGRSTISTWVRK